MNSNEQPNEQRSGPPLYALQLPHSGLHIVRAALDTAMALTQGDIAHAMENAEYFGRFMGGKRMVVGLELRRDVTLLHFDAIRADGHGDELDPQAAPSGAELDQLELERAEATDQYNDVIAKVRALIASGQDPRLA